MLIEQVERLIERFYLQVQTDPETIEAVSAMIPARFDEMMAEGAVGLADPHTLEAGRLTSVSAPGNRPDEGLSGTVVRRIEHLQTFPSASEVNGLVDDCRSGVSVNEFAEGYGVHRATA